MIKRWDIVTIGNLSRNRYWGESEERGLRSALCTSTVIQGDGFRLLVDPPIAEPGPMAAELFRRTGLKTADIDAVFVTHEHNDHWAGIEVFAAATWCAAPAVAEVIGASGRCTKALKGVTGKLLDVIEVVPTPGHTNSHHSLRFQCNGWTVVVAGDAVMTADFWAERRGYFNSVDFAQASATIAALAQTADAVVPGHDNWFPVRAGK